MGHRTPHLEGRPGTNAKLLQEIVAFQRFKNGRESDIPGVQPEIYG